jgi:hypothetical protein
MKLLRAVLIVFVFTVPLFAQFFGPPNYLWVGTWALQYQNDPCGASECPRALLHRDKFVNELQSHIANSGNTIGFNHYLNYENTNASIESFNNIAKDMCEIVYYYGHGTDTANGNVGGKMSFRNGTNCQYGRNFQYGGQYTKWVFTEACNFFKFDQNPANYISMFNGAHAIFGFASLNPWFFTDYGGWWDCAWGGCSHHRSEDRWTYFWDNYFNGQEMWTAFTNAMHKSADEADEPIECAAVQLKGLINCNNGWCNMFFGAAEGIDYTYNGELYPDGNFHVEFVTEEIGPIVL